ncbi:MAG: tetratricopeptide repeat protein [Candidatus Binatia bacterium]
MSKPKTDDKKKHRPASNSATPNAAIRIDVVISLAIFILAVAVRLLYLSQIEAIPLFYHLVSDGHSYDEWAQRIATGDWIGREVFYQAPLYPYFLGLLQFFFGRDLWFVRVVQMILGAASCVLLYWTGRTFFSRTAGVAAGLILALYAPAIFFEALIQKTILDLFLISSFLFLLSRAQQKPHWSHWLGAGTVLGLLGLCRENALIWVLVVAVWTWLYFVEYPLQSRLHWTAAFLAGLVLILLPVGLRNLHVGGEFTLTTSQLGPNFFIGNNLDATGVYAPLRPGHGDAKFERQDATELAQQALGKNLSPGEVSRYWLMRARDYIRDHPFEWLRLTAKKWLMVWNVRELEDADDFYLYQHWSPLLQAMGVASHFGVLAPLAAMGCFLTWRQRRRLWLLYGLIISLALSVTFFYVFARYRVSLVPLLALLAGAGVIEGFTLSRAKLMARVAAALAVLSVTAAVVHWPVIGKPAPSAAGYNNLANAFSKQGKLTSASDNYQQALALRPEYGTAHFNLGNLLVHQGDFNKAGYHLAEAIRINSAHAEAYNSLANLFARQGKLESAVQQYRKALDLGLSGAEIHFNLGVILAKLGRLDQASDSLKESLRVNPDFAPSYNSLGRLLAVQGHLDQAIEYFRRAISLQQEFAQAHESLGHALAEQGNRTEAVKHYQEALRILKSRKKLEPIRSTE